MNESEKIKNIDIFCKSLKNFEKEVVVNLNSLDSLTIIYFCGYCVLILRDRKITLKHYFSYIFFGLLNTTKYSKICFDFSKKYDKDFEKNLKHVNDIFTKKIVIKEQTDDFVLIEYVQIKHIEDILLENFHVEKRSEIWKIFFDKNKKLLTKILGIKLRVQSIEETIEETREEKPKRVRKSSKETTKREKKVYDKKFQKKDADINSPLYYFYTSLYDEKPDSELAIKWLCTNGIYEGKKREKLENKYEKILNKE
jgi:hypothetical protein